MTRWFLIPDLLVALCLPFLSFGQRSAMVDIDSLIKLMPETQTAIKKLDSAFTFYEKKLETLSDSMNWMQKNTPKGPKVSEQQKKDYIKKFNALNDRLIRFQKEAETALESYRLSLHAPIEQNVKALCMEVARKKGYAVVVDIKRRDKGILYSEKEPEDITWMVILEMGK
jgi:Skp family chaperone for outer membrane proteins